MNSTSFPAKLIKKKSVVKRIFKFIGVVVASIIGLFIVLAVIVSVTDSKKSDETATTKPSATTKPKYKLGDRKSPVPVGNEFSYGIEQFTALIGANKHRFEISLQVNEVVRGKDALTKIKNWNELNADPKDGYEYLLLKVALGVIKSKDDVSLNVNQSILSMVSGDGIKYENKFLVINDSFEAEMYEGAKHAGWAAFEVKASDTNPLIKVAGTWFRAYQ